MENQDNKKKDYLDGDHSAKNWFKIMWSNTYIQLFVLGLAFFIGVLLNYDSFEGQMWGFWVMLAIPFLVMVVIAYKGFYQFWNDLKNGQSR